MKTIYIFLFSLCLSLNLSAQKYNTLIMEEWVNGNWKNAMRYTNTYDVNGNITKVNMDSLNYATNLWEQSMITSYTLNSNSTINYSIMQIWNVDDNIWEEMKTIYTYDGLKNILTEKMQMFVDPDWWDLTMTTNTYNGSGQLIKSVSQMMLFMTQNTSQTTYTYNPDGTENQSISQVWNGAWENSQRFTNTYDAAKKITSVLTEDFTTGLWVNSSKSTITYNANGSIKEALDQDWNVSGSNWVDSGKEIYSYDANGSLKEMLMMDWLPAQSKWENGSRLTYTYSTTSIIQPELAATSHLLVFPNPFTDVISIEYSSLKESSIQLYSINGQLLRIFEKREPLSKINLGGLKNGIYLLKVVSPESEQVVKLLKIK